MLVEHYKL
jgi:hypothetical protein